MPRLLVFQHVAHEILGTLDPLLRSYGFRVRYLNFDREPDREIDITGYHGLVVLGGPMNVDQVDRHPHLANEVEAIRVALDRELPILGICLGAQLLAKALGADVYPNGEKEIGWFDVDLTEVGRSDPLFAHFEARERLFQWHGDTFDLPEGAELLASSPACEGQAFRYGTNAYGLQFHLEVDAPMIERWLNVPLHLEELEELGGSAYADEIRRETPLHAGRLQRLGEKSFESFIELFGDLSKRPPHPHR